jgi:hypothetical protein
MFSASFMSAMAAPPTGGTISWPGTTAWGQKRTNRPRPKTHAKDGQFNQQIQTTITDISETATKNQ